MLYVYRFNFGCGRGGSLKGIFVVDENGKADLDYLIEEKVRVDFGEVLGKHSDVSGNIVGDCTLLDASQEDIAAMLRVFGVTGFRGHVTISGYNPLDYVVIE